MGKVIIIGAGGVASVAAHKVAKNPDVFTDIMIASRTKSKCDALVKAIGNPAIKTAKTVMPSNVSRMAQRLRSLENRANSAPPSHKTMAEMANHSKLFHVIIIATKH